MTGLEMTPLINSALGLWAVSGGLALTMIPDARKTNTLSWDRFTSWTNWLALVVLMFLSWGAAQVFQLDMNSWMYVKIGFWASMASVILFPSEVTRGWIILGVALAVSIALGSSDDAVSHFTAMAWGLCFSKIAAGWLLKPSEDGCSSRVSCWQDILAPLTLLGGMTWSAIMPPFEQATVFQSLSIILVAIVWTLRVVTALPVVSTLNPKWLLPLVSSVAGGIMLVMATSNGLLKPGMALWSLWFGVSLLLMATISCLSACHANDDEPKSFARLYWPMGALAILGLAALLLSRLVGPIGWAFLAASAVGCLGFSKGNRWVTLAALFALSKLWMMSLVNTTNANVSGVNLMHTYTTAAATLGLAAVWLMPTWIRSFQSPAAMVWSLVVGVLVLPPVLNMFLHNEPSQGFYIAFAASAAVCGFLPLHPRDENSWPIYEGMMALGVLLPIAAQMWAPLYELGNTATRTQQIWAVAAMLVVLVVGILLPRWMPKPPISTH